MEPIRQAPFDINTLDLNQHIPPGSKAQYIYPNQGVCREGFLEGKPFYLNISKRDLDLINKEFFQQLDRPEAEKSFIMDQYLGKGPFLCDYIAIFVGILALGVIIYLASTEQLFSSGTHEISGVALAFTLIALARLLYTCDRNRRITQVIKHLYIAFALYACKPYLEPKLYGTRYVFPSMACTMNNLWIAADYMWAPVDRWGMSCILSDHLWNQLDINSKGQP